MASYVTLINNEVTVTRPVTKTVEEAYEVNVEEYGYGLGGSAVARYTLASAASDAQTETVEAPEITFDLTPGRQEEIVAGSVLFSLYGTSIGTIYFYDHNGAIYHTIDATTGLGTECGSIDYSTGIVTLTYWPKGLTPQSNCKIHSLVTKVGNQIVYETTFRCPSAPIRPGSFTLQGTLVDGATVSATANASGAIQGNYCQGYIDYETGIVVMLFGGMVSAEDLAGNEGEDWYDADLIQPTGDMWLPVGVKTESLMYSCVAYSYLPLDADLIGIDPVRLPSDGRVPICNDGDIVVVHHTQTDVMPNGLSASQEITLSRGDLSLVELYDADGVYVPTTEYSVDLMNGVITMAEDMDLTGFTEPLVANHRREDMLLCNDVQITGSIAMTGQLRHDYPAGAYVSSALPYGDLSAAVTNVFDQQTWTNEWANEVIGNTTVANYNTVNYPITVTNKGAITQRWLIKFTSATTYQVIGENVGVIAEGDIYTTCAPENPATAVPYFTIDADGWGSGWATGYCLRFNTTAANQDLWIARTTLSGEVTEPNDQFTIQIRGDAD